MYERTVLYQNVSLILVDNKQSVVRHVLCVTQLTPPLSGYDIGAIDLCGLKLHEVKYALTNTIHLDSLLSW